ncbi:MAG: hypothetical protein HZA90_22475 [Verrucomicrobia bacterium]|nr:hypothetical protein [Verrucomicrobiota bacterium]
MLSKVRESSQPAWWLLMFAGTLGVWALGSLIEKNSSILFFAVLVGSFGLLICFSLPDRKQVLTMFSAGLLVRSIVTLASWWLSKGTDYECYTGDNEDSLRFFLMSFLDIHDSVVAAEDMGFPAVNSAITEIAGWMGGTHYLCNTQLPVTFGALFPVAAFLVARDRLNGEVARIAGWLLAFHPIVIGWSSGLMRDTLVSTTFWLCLYYLLRFRVVSGMLTLQNVVPVLIYGAATFLLRATNLTALGACFAIVGATDCLRLGFKRVGALYIPVVLASIFVLLHTVVGERDIARVSIQLEYGKAARETVGQTEASVNEGGISEMIANSQSTTVLLASAPYCLITPFPWYASFLSFEVNLARPVVFLFGLGGLLNQLLFPLYICGLMLVTRMRRWDLLAMFGVFVGAVSVMGAMSGFQTRWTMTVAYVPMILAASLVINTARGQVGAQLGLWSGASGFVLTLYIGYWLIKMVSVVLGVAFIAVIAPVTLLLMANQLSKSPRKNRPKRTSDVAAPSDNTSGDAPDAYARLEHKW